MKRGETFYVKMVKKKDSEQSIHVIDAEDAFEAIKLIRNWVGGGMEYNTIEAYPWHGKIYYPRKLR